MEVHKLFTDDRAVSPVVGVALLIAVAVILAAVIGAVVLGLGTGGVETPQAQLQAQFTDTNSNGNDDVVISHNGGEPLPADEVVVQLEGDTTENSVSLGNDLTAGDSVTFESGDTNDLGANEDIKEATVIWEDPNSDSETVLERFSA